MQQLLNSNGARGVHGEEARFGTISADFDYYYNWKDIFPEEYKVVEIAPGKEGLVHISNLDTARVKEVSDICAVGDKMKVKVIKIDRQGRIDLSRKEVLEES